MAKMAYTGSMKNGSLPIARLNEDIPYDKHSTATVLRSSNGRGIGGGEPLCAAAALHRINKCVDKSQQSP
jgi:hypothetical protein